MFLTIKKDKIYRDAIIYHNFFAILLFCLLAWTFSHSPYEPSGKIFLGLGFLVLGFFIFVVISWWLHGSITLDNEGGVLEFSQSRNLDIPSFTVPRENIDQVKVRSIGWNLGLSYILILCIRNGHQYEEKQLKLAFCNLDDCYRGAQLIGKFANAPAFYDEKQIFTPKNREDIKRKPTRFKYTSRRDSNHDRGVEVFILIFIIVGLVLWFQKIIDTVGLLWSLGLVIFAASFIEGLIKKVVRSNNWFGTEPCSLHDETFLYFFYMVLYLIGAIGSAVGLYIWLF